MQVRDLHEWPTTESDALALQDELRELVDLSDPGPVHVDHLAGLDVAYSPTDDTLVAAVVVMRSDTLAIVEKVVVADQAGFPYIPGLFAFRELPPLVTALKRLTTSPGLLLCDGHGLAHPRRFGIASHLGVLTGLPTVGVAKNILNGHYDDPPPERGSWSPIREGEQEIGRALRTRTRVKPVFVSPGNRISLENASRYVLDCTAGYRIPEPIRQADHLTRRSGTTVDVRRC